MKLINKILSELKYTETGNFSFIQNLNNEEKGYEVSAFVSKLNPSQVYLMTSVDFNNLNNALDGSFYALLAKQLRKQEFYTSEMDKNTTLIIECECNNNQYLNSDIKVQIEDDPFYFKKYVLCYNEIERMEAERFLANEQNKYKEEFSFVRTIQTYLADTKKFTEYKKDRTSQPIYGYFAEMAIKMPIMPLQIATDSQIKKIPDFISEELAQASRINIKGIENLLDKFNASETMDVETILSVWNNSLDK